VSPLASQLSWAHIVKVLPLKNTEAKQFYLSEAAKHRLGKRDLPFEQKIRSILQEARERASLAQLPEPVEE